MEGKSVISKEDGALLGIISREDDTYFITPTLFLKAGLKNTENPLLTMDNTKRITILKPLTEKTSMYKNTIEVDVPFYKLDLDIESGIIPQIKYQIENKSFVVKVYTKQQGQPQYNKKEECPLLWIGNLLLKDHLDRIVLYQRLPSMTAFTVPFNQKDLYIKRIDEKTVLGIGHLAMLMKSEITSVPSFTITWSDGTEEIVHHQGIFQEYRMDTKKHKKDPCFWNVPPSLQQERLH